jgi:hypothetical protein
MRGRIPRLSVHGLVLLYVVQRGQLASRGGAHGGSSAFNRGAAAVVFSVSCGSTRWL